MASFAYEPLKKLFYKDASSDRFAANAALTQQRLRAEGTFRTGIMLGDDELFLATPRELSLASERVLQREREIERLWSALPHVACGALLRSLILDEVQSSNDIEGVHSTRREIQAALDAARTGSVPHVPYLEFARLYLNLTEGRTECPERVEDIRAVYDSVVEGAVEAADMPDGRVFRKGPVCITDGMKSVHEGVMPESRIELMMGQMISLASSPLMPSLYSALLSHLVFEYVHPFYDGNGRTGRYLLSLYLARVLSLPTVLSISRTIAEDKRRYYRAFAGVQHPMNHAEGTFFVLDMLVMVEAAQETLVSELQEKGCRLEAVLAAVERARREAGLSGKAGELLVLAAELEVFSADGLIWVPDAQGHLLCSESTARRYLHELEATGYLELVGKRPLSYRLSARAREAAALP